MKLNSPSYSKSQRLITNKSFSFVKPTEIKNFSDLLLIIEFASRLYKKIFWQFINYEQTVKNGVWTSVYKKIDKISMQVGCSEKTVDRFLRDLNCLVQHKQQYWNGKQSSNIYSVPEHIQKYSEAFRQVGLFKTEKGFKKNIKYLWLKWEESNFNFDHMMKLLTTREQFRKSLSPWKEQKCPSNIYTNSLSINSTYKVPHQDAKRIDSWIKGFIRRSMEDIKWYTLEKNKKIRCFEAFFKERFKSCLSY